MVLISEAMVEKKRSQWLINEAFACESKKRWMMNQRRWMVVVAIYKRKCLRAGPPREVRLATARWASAAAWARKSCHRRGPKTVLAQTAELTKYHVIFVVFFKFGIEKAGGEDFNQFLIDIPSFWCIICLCSWIRWYLPPKILVAVHSDCGNLSLIIITPDRQDRSLV